ncbi:hypothetical protein [Nafulsella turpanensis]|uniref:hypothetical protein n=1 Tax=Nafulsella turpanensis TaxID=1265690 RepID=UPI0003499B94|nr:hypothetical protein [Nafulsella turpanensis]
MGFSTFFTVIFGAVLLATNIGDRKAKWVVIGFGILYTALAIIVINQLPQSSAITLAINAAGAVMLTEFFWKKYVGNKTRFRRKPIWKPLIISVLITIPFILAMIYGY